MQDRQPAGALVMRATRAVVAWSCGKDSAAALWRLQADPAYEVVGLLTTITRDYGRVSMSGVREELLAAQAASLGLRRYTVPIPAACPMEAYDTAMAAAAGQLVSEGVGAIGFGDLFLEDVRSYREQRLAGTGLRPVFPLWGEDTGRLSRWLIRSGFRATIVCADPKAVPPDVAGRAYDDALLDDLPEEVDPCGENGEFHTFVHDAPNFGSPVAFTAGERVLRDGFWFADLLPGWR